MRDFLSATAVCAICTAPALAQDTDFALDEIVFSPYAQPTAISRVGTSVEVIEIDDLDTTGNVQLSQVLATLSGVSFTDQGPPGTAAQLRIRGAGSEYISVYVDGILVTDPSAVEQSFDNFGGLTTGSIRRIEILRGSQSALYGGTAVGGVVNITTLADSDGAPGLSQTVEVQGGSYGTASLDYTMAYRTDSATLSFGLSHVQSDGFSAGDEDFGNTEADGYDQTRLTFGYEHDVDGALTLGVNGFYEQGSVEFDEFDFVLNRVVDGTPDELAERETFGVRGFLRYETAGGWTHDAAIAGYAIERQSSGNGTTDTFEAERLTFDYQLGGEVSPNLALAFGLDARSETARYTQQAGGENTVDTIGTFAEAVWSPDDTFDLTATLRYDDHSTFGGQTTGRIAYAWRPTDALTLRGALATGYRPPSLDELFGDYGFFVGNPALTPETSFSAEIGADYQLGNVGLLSATLFHLEIDDLITFDGSVTPNTLVNEPGISTRQGVELAAAIPVNDRVTLTGAYTYTDAHRADGTRLANIPRHDLVLGVDAMVTDRLSLGLTAQHVADRANSSFDPDLYTDYTVLDAVVTYGIADEIDAFFRIENLTDEAYQSTSGYGTSDRAFYVGLRAAF